LSANETTVPCVPLAIGRREEEIHLQDAGVGRTLCGDSLGVGLQTELALVVGLQEAHFETRRCVVHDSPERLLSSTLENFFQRTRFAMTYHLSIPAGSQAFRARSAAAFGLERLRVAFLLFSASPLRVFSSPREKVGFLAIVAPTRLLSGENLSSSPRGKRRLRSSEACGILAPLGFRSHGVGAEGAIVGAVVVGAL